MASRLRRKYNNAMKYSIRKLQTDVMARLGEIAQPQSLLSMSGVPWPEDIIGLKVRTLLGETASRLIREAPVESLGCGVSLICGDVSMRMMPCGLYGAEWRLPDGFLRLISVKMAGWTGGVNHPIVPGSSEWRRQWSAERGIAGCPERPRAYLDSDGEGMMLRLLGSESEEDTLEWLSGWSVPEISEEDEFEFPEGLYSELVGAVAGRIME